MSFFSSICNGISSVCSSIGSGISSAVSAIGSALSSFAANIAPLLSNIISTLPSVFTLLLKFAPVFLAGLGILKPDEKVDDMGERALQAAEKGITIDMFDNFDDYMDALRNFDLDPEVASKRNPTEKLVAGLGVGTVGVEDKFLVERGSLNAMWLLPIANPDYFTPDRMQSLVATGRLGCDIYAYLEKRLSGGESRSIEKGFEVEAEGKTMNDAERDKLYDALDSAREGWAELANKVQSHNNPSQGD